MPYFNIYADAKRAASYREEVRKKSPQSTFTYIVQYVQCTVYSCMPMQKGAASYREEMREKFPQSTCTSTYIVQYSVQLYAYAKRAASYRGEARKKNFPQVACAR